MTQSQITPKSKLIQTAADLVYRQGWNATGINQILGEAKVPKGSFYYYFHSKEDLGVAIVRHQAALLRERYDRTILDERMSGRDGLIAYFSENIDLLREGGLRWGCPIGSLSSEVVDTTAKISDACREFMSDFSGAVVQAVARGQCDGSIRSELDAALLGSQICSLWQGSLLYMRVCRSDAPLVAAVQAINGLLDSGLAK